VARALLTATVHATEDSGRARSADALRPCCVRIVIERIRWRWRPRRERIAGLRWSEHGRGDRYRWLERRRWSRLHAGRWTVPGRLSLRLRRPGPGSVHLPPGVHDEQRLLVAGHDVRMLGVRSGAQDLRERLLLLLRVAPPMTRYASSLMCLAVIAAASLGCNSSSTTNGTGAGGAGGDLGGHTGGESGQGNAAGATSTGGHGPASDNTGGGTGACGGTDCASGKICIHLQCLNCSPEPAPFCTDIPAACSGTATCSCLPFAICDQNGQAAGACVSVDSSGVHCG
jgi:hypothetical protein